MTPRCRPFIEYSMTAQYADSSKGKLWSFLWDGNFLCATYPDQTVDEYLNVSRATAQQILQSKNALATFNQVLPNLIPVIMFTENIENGAWQVETDGYITTC